MNEHVSDLDLERFRAGRLDRASVEAVGAHVRECASCAARVWNSRGVRDATDSVLRNVAKRETRWRTIAAAAILVLVAALASYAVLRPRPVQPPIAVLPDPRPAQHPWDALVAAALRSGELQPPASLLALRSSGEVVRGTEPGVDDVRLLAPVGVSVESQRPQFRWTAKSGAYEVTVARNGEVAAKSGRITETNWTPPMPLPRDATYEWQLTVEKNGRRLRVPSPEERVRFRVISDDELQLLAAARAAGDPIATGIVAANAGLLDEAIALLGGSPDPRAKALAEKIRRW